MNSHSKRQAGRTGPWLQALMALILGAMLLAAGPARNPLKGALGDALHAVRCGFGHNLFLFWPHSSLYAPDSACRYRRSSRHCWSPPVTVDLFRAENVIIQDGLLRDTT